MPADNDKTLTLYGVYNTLYNAATRPDFKFAVTRYFIDEWLPLLGPSLAWLVVGLRQQCYWNQRRNWCIVDKASLARDTALNERTIERCLKKPFSDWFVAEVVHRYRYRSQIGKKVRDKNRYQLLLDEPLSPRHQLGLAGLLRQVVSTEVAKTSAGDDPVAAALAAVQNLLTLPDLTGKISYSGELPETLQRRTVLELVEATLDFRLADHAGNPRLAELDQGCARLYNQIVQPNKIYVGWQYFRLEWVPRLGHALAWLVIYMRRHCYWDEASGELRDTFSAYKKDIAAAIGQTSRNLANLMAHPQALLFFTPLEENRAEGSAGPTSYRVRLVDEPLAPDDQQRVAVELQQRLQGQFYGQDPESGQLNLFPLLDRLSGRQNFAYGQAAEKTPPTETKNRRLETESPEKMAQHDPASTGKNAVTLNDSLKPSSILERPTEPKRSAAELNGLKLLFDDLSIQEPARSKLLANPNLTIAHVGAWFLYAETQPGLRDPQGYVIKRLLANDPPPAEFLVFARLDDAIWTLFEESLEHLQTGQPLAAEVAPELVDTFVNWAEIYGDLPAAETRRLLARPRAAKTGPATPADSRPGASPEPEPAERAAARSLWLAALEQLRLQMTQQSFNNWLRQTELLDYRENVFVINAKNLHAKAWLETRLVQTIEKTLTTVVGAPTRVRFVVEERKT
jgi:hypothetical protein